MNKEEEALLCIFQLDLMEQFDIISVKELGNVKAKEDYYEVIFEEKPTLPEGLNVSEYESQGYFSKVIQDFPS